MDHVLCLKEDKFETFKLPPVCSEKKDVICNA